MKKKFTLLITAMALLLGSGGVAWGQINYTAPNNSTSYPDCDNNYGAGESATITVNTMSLGNGKITLGGVANVIGHFSSGGNRPGNHNNTPNTTIYTDGTSSCHGSVSSSQTMPSYSYCTFWGESDKGTHWMYQQSTPTFGTTTTVEIAPGYSLGTPLVLQQYYFLDIPWYYRTWRLYTYTSTNLGCCGSNPCTGTDYRQIAGMEENTPNNTITYPGSNRGGYVDGHVIVDAASHVRLTSNAQSNYGIGAGTHGFSKATITFPAPANFTNYSYSIMIDSTFRENTLLTGAGGAANNISPLAEHAVFGVNAGYYPGTKISTHQAGGTILIGNTTQGQDKMKS